MCSPLFPSIESAVPTFKDVRAAVARASWQRARATWIPDQWLDRESVHSDARRSEKHVVKLVDEIVQDIRSGAPTDMKRTPFNSERPQLSVDA